MLPSFITVVLSNVQRILVRSTVCVVAFQTIVSLYSSRSTKRIIECLKRPPPAQRPITCETFPRMDLQSLYHWIFVIIVSSNDISNLFPKYVKQTVHFVPNGSHQLRHAYMLLITRTTVLFSVPKQTNEYINILTCFFRSLIKNSSCLHFVEFAQPSDYQNDCYLRKRAGYISLLPPPK